MTSNAEEPLLEAEEVSPAREVSERTVRPRRRGLFPAPSFELVCRLEISSPSDGILIPPAPTDQTPSGDPSHRHAIDHALAGSRRFVRKVNRKTRRLLLLKQLSQFVVSSQAVPVAVGLLFGQCLSKNADAFVAAFVSPLIAALSGEYSHLANAHFTINGAVFAWGAFAESLLETACTVVATFYLVVVPMSRVTALKWTPQRACPECQSWIKETCRRCPICTQPVVFPPRREEGDDEEEE